MVAESGNENFTPVVFYHRADAEFILTVMEEWVYEIMMTEDPWEVFGEDQWNWAEDYRELFLTDYNFMISEAILY